MVKQKSAFLIQARTGSTRLPKKMLLPFYDGKTILEIIIENLKNGTFDIPIVLATTVNPNDDILKNIADKMNILHYRGDEEDVLQRFIDTANHFKIDTVIRVCADNPFLSINYIENLISNFKQNSNVDYLSYQNSSGTPTIKTHYGFFSELVKLSALKKVAEQTHEKYYREHVTNYIYEHKQDFSIMLLKIPFEENEKVRLTIDTIDDFNTSKEIYKYFVETKIDITPENMMKFLNKNTHYLEVMNKQIQLQQK